MARFGGGAGAGVRHVTIADLGAVLAKGQVTAGDLAADVGRGALERARTALLPGPALQRDRDPGSPKSARGQPPARASQPLTAAERAATALGLESARALGTTRSLRTAGEDGGGSRSALEGDEPRVRIRKRFGAERGMTFADLFDEAAEKVVIGTIEQPWCLESCMQHPRCQRVCFPADYATRDRRKAAEDAEGQGQGGRGCRDSELVHLGLPDFAQAGFTLVSLDELNIADKTLSTKLGFQLATHRKTSVQRYCFQYSKAKLPYGTNAQEFKGFVNRLIRNDHVNVLSCQAVFEDAEYIYFMYEYYPCVTLLYMMDRHQWDQEQVVNIARECCAAVAHSASVGLLHLGWTLCHVLIPAAAAEGGDPMVAKVFGFGLMGSAFLDSLDHDRICWGPEFLEKFRAGQEQGKEGSNFVPKIEAQTRAACDSWSLGVVIYALVARQPPMLTEQQVLTKKWQFTLAIDEVDPEAKPLIEGFLNPGFDRRIKAERALHHEWIRRRWRPPPGADEVFCKLEDFVYSPLPKRLFGRFLQGFLDPDHLRKIARIFYALDSQGNGVIMLKELQVAAKTAGKPLHAANDIFKWLAQDASQVSLRRFAECFAEEVIDGRALRHAFESLDDDGSEEVSAEELFDVLNDFDTSLKLEEVVAHIKSTELNLGDQGGATQDHQLDYTEFGQLFPVRVARLKALDDRMQSTRDNAEALSERFKTNREAARTWLTSAEQTLGTIEQLSDKTVERNEGGSEAARSLKKHFVKLDDLLRTPPGPQTQADFDMAAQASRKQKALRGKRQKQQQQDDDRRKNKETVLGFDSFLQDQALMDQWSTMIMIDIRNLKQALCVGRKLSDSVDQYKAHDAAESVCGKVKALLTRARAQLTEYEAFVEALEEPEASMEPMPLSGRGLRELHGQGHKDDMGDADDEDHERSKNPMLRFIHDVTARLTNGG